MDVDERRRRAAELFAAGRRQADVARELGVSRVTALDWYRRWQAHGVRGLAPRPRGARPRLSSIQERRIDRALTGSPRDAGIPSEGWSLAAVTALIERVAGVRYHPHHVSRVLRRMGWWIPPFGRHRAHARRVRRAVDPDGNGLVFQQRHPPVD